jgi:hypothetical protein
VSEIAERITEFIRRAARANIRNNMILNSLFTWLTNRDMAPAALEGGMAMDTVVTCIFMSAIMTIFTSASVAGQL